MKKRIQILAAVWMVASSVAMADSHLTPKQCTQYPFKKPTGEVTQRQLQRELRELEAVGYNPSADNNYYPNDIEKAENKLQAEYKRDCSPNAAANANVMPGVAQGGS